MTTPDSSQSDNPASDQVKEDFEERAVPMAVLDDGSGTGGNGDIHRRPWPLTRYFWWILPILALAMAAVLMYQAFLQRGQQITIAFNEGNGLSVGSPVEYRGVEVGNVRDVHLDRDHAKALILVELRQDSSNLAVAGSRFWVVRPSVSLNGITGLDTLIGPNYIALDPGPAKGAKQLFFNGLDTPPNIVKTNPDALHVIVRAPRRGSLKVGSPVYYRDIPVGRIIDYRLSNDSTRVEFDVEIDHQYAVILHEKSRFWNASGIGIDFGWFGGLSFRADSLESVVSGGIAFATPPLDEADQPAAEGATFDLADKADSDWLKWQPTIPRKPK